MKRDILFLKSHKWIAGFTRILQSSRHGPGIGNYKNNRCRLEVTLFLVDMVCIILSWGPMECPGR